MKFISLTTMIMSTALITETAIAEQISDYPCVHAYRMAYSCTQINWSAECSQIITMITHFCVDLPVIYAFEGNG
ncbi:hypothetical protein F4604DRAFT_1723260 [Suillus subluteus]|nr:hypothetical protein F4604DRAFT_1723260 [Suillus subluteus]